MNTEKILDPSKPSRVWISLLSCLFVLVASVWLASFVQRDFGEVEVTNVEYENFNGIQVRAKLLKPVSASSTRPMPGIVYIHGYQNNRETSDAYCIELARRGFVVLNIDAIGRGNSGVPNDPEDPDFDETYGGRTSLEYLRSLAYVDASRTGMMGHSLGAEMAYKIGLRDTSVKALVISGFGYTTEATKTSPKNMLMIIGKWDEFRDRMTGVRDIEQEWMSTPQSLAVMPVDDPEIGVTYGNFSDGTARRVFVPHVIHLQESHDRKAIAEALEWMKTALEPDESFWVDSSQQIWPIKEWATLVALISGIVCLLPLGLLLLRSKFFQSVSGTVSGAYSCSNKSLLKYASVNGILIWLYLPLIFVLFGLHVYVIPIDKVFPMMMVNGIVWWFFLINVLGFFLFRGWYRRRKDELGLSLSDLGISFKEERFGLEWRQIGKTLLLACILFGFAYLLEHFLEQIFIVDYRFIFPFASDLTPYRVGLFFLYFPFLLVGFVFLGLFLHAQIRRPKKETWLKTFASWSVTNILVLIVPILLFMMIQYIPLFTTGLIPLVGPGGMFVTFMLNLFHIIGVLIIVTPVSTWFYQITGKIYLGAILNAFLVAWMFTSSQVIAPIPV
jgi:dienelactone hydrolase